MDKENRKSQEEFICLDCGYKCNADYNASQNIKIFADSNVIGQLLFEFNVNGWKVPKKLGKFKICKILDDWFEQNTKQKDSRNTINSYDAVDNNKLSTVSVSDLSDRNIIECHRKL